MSDIKLMFGFSFPLATIAALVEGAIVLSNENNPR